MLTHIMWDFQIISVVYLVYSSVDSALLNPQTAVELRPLLT